jgi:ABC-type cobalamin/Fe3+-siderophores transport system ATPase subunit
MTSVKRLRIFAGPNGSGKSTLVKVVMDLNIHLGVYVNADDIKSELDHYHFIDLNKYFPTIHIDHLKISLQQTSFYDSNLGKELSKGLTVQHNCLTHPKLFAISQNNTISLTNPDYFPIWFQKYVVDKISPLNNHQ